MADADVVHVITDRDRRGAQIFACDLASELGHRRRSVKTLALVAGRDPVALAVPFLGKRALAAGTISKLRSELRHAKVVIAHGSSTLAASAAAILGTDVTLVYRSIGDPLYWSHTRARRLRMRLLLRRASVVVALWPAAAASLIDHFGIPSDRVRVISNGVPIKRFAMMSAEARADCRRRYGIDAGVPTAVYLGSLTFEKNVGAAVAAVALLPNAQLLVAGQGPERPKLERLASRVAPGRVRFITSTDRPIDLLAAADALVLPSLTEGVPAVLIEAMLSGLPVVATSVGGVGEVVVDGENGRLVPPGDHVALAEALQTTFAPNGSTTARPVPINRFDIEAVATAWDDLLAELGAWKPARATVT